MTYNHYRFLLDNYRKRGVDGMVGADPGVIAVRKAVHRSYQHEASRARERYRQDMARQKRQQVESERLINLKIRQLKMKEREISKRYEHVKTRVTYGDTRIGRSADRLPKISCTRPGGPLPKRNQRFIESRYEFETFPKGTNGNENVLLLPSVDVSELNVSDNEAVKLDREQRTRFPTLPQQKATKTYTGQCSQAAANRESASERALPDYLTYDFTSVMRSIQEPEDTVADRVFAHNQPALTNDPITSPLDSTRRDLVQYYKSEIEGSQLNPAVEVLSSRLQKPDKYEMLLLDSLDSRPEQIRVDQVDPHDPGSSYDILAIEDDVGASDSQEE